MWDDNGVHTTPDDVMPEEMGTNDFGVVNVDEVEDMSMDNSAGTIDSTNFGRADVSSLPSCATEAGRKNVGDDSSQESGKKRNSTRNSVTPDRDRQKKRRQVEDDGLVDDSRSENQSASNSDVEIVEKDATERDKQNLQLTAGHGDVPGGDKN